jgi:hypothetical protein
MMCLLFWVEPVAAECDLVRKVKLTEWRWDRGTEQGRGYMPSRARLTETLPRSGLLEPFVQADIPRQAVVCRLTQTLVGAQRRGHGL